MREIKNVIKTEIVDVSKFLYKTFKDLKKHQITSKSKDTFSRIQKVLGTCKKKVRGAVV